MCVTDVPGFYITQMVIPLIPVVLKALSSPVCGDCCMICHRTGMRIRWEFVTSVLELTTEVVDRAGG